MSDIPLFNPWAPPIFVKPPEQPIFPTGAAFGTVSPAEDAQRQPTIVDNLLSHIAGALGRGFMAPGNALNSPTPLTSEQMIAPAMDMTNLLVGGGMPMAEAGALGMAGGKIGSGSLFDTVAAKYPQLKIDGSPARSANDYATLSRIAVPEDLRGQGLATKAMQDIVAEADKAGTNLALSPSADWGASIPRLKEFYQRFGFVPNAGKNKDFATRETMIRPPKKSD